MRLLLFFILNFGALALGSYLMGEGPTGSWYSSLQKAPWTPPGWVFGASWTLIMVLLAFFMNKAVASESLKSTIWTLYILQLILNVAWNPMFFHYHITGWALIELLALLGLVAVMALQSRPHIGASTWLLLPYIIWLSIASTLNAYAYLHN